MIFNLIIFVLFVAVAYFQYAQGLFSALLTAIISILAAVLAVGYHEFVASYLLSKMPDEADAVALVGIFVVAFLAMRLIFDRLVPGNVRYPVLVDKIGAGAAGVITGLFSTGILAVAAQTLPFGASIGGFTRQDTGPDRPVAISGDEAGKNYSVDAVVSDEIMGSKLGDSVHGLWFNQDGIVVQATQGLSEAGSVLDNGHPLEDVHPAYLNELFGQRMGLDPSSKHTATDGANVDSAYIVTKPRAIDSEIKSVRGDQPLPDLSLSDGPTTLVVVRVNFGGDNISDSDGFVRLSPAAVRLKLGNNDYYPAGTLVGGGLLLENRFDDPLMIDTKSGEPVDFVFPVLTDDLDSHTDGKTKQLRFKDGSFLEVKRFVRCDLSGHDLAPEPPDQTVNIKEYQSAGVLGGVVRKPTQQLSALLHVAIDAINNNQNQAAQGPRNLQHQEDNELDPTRIPIHQMGL